MAQSDDKRTKKKKEIRYRREKTRSEGGRERERESRVYESVHAAVFHCALYAKPGLPYSIFLPS